MKQSVKIANFPGLLGQYFIFIYLAGMVKLLHPCVYLQLFLIPCPVFAALEKYL